MKYVWGREFFRWSNKCLCNRNLCSLSIIKLYNRRCLEAYGRKGIGFCMLLFRWRDTQQKQVFILLHKAYGVLLIMPIYLLELLLTRNSELCRNSLMVSHKHIEEHTKQMFVCYINIEYINKYINRLYVCILDHVS